MPNVLRVTGGWIGTIFALLFVVWAAFQRAPLAAVAFLAAAFIACPALWTTLDRKGIRISALWMFPIWAVGMLIMAIGGGGSGPSSASTKTDASGTSGSDKLSNIRWHVPDSALPAMTKKGYPKMYARLGKAAFKRGNDLAFWAGIAAVEDPTCGIAETVGVSDKATRSNLKWFVNCATGERFVISEQQAVAARGRHDPDASPAQKEAALKVAAAEPRSARFKDFNEPMAVATCDRIVKESALNRGSVSLAWSWDTDKDADTGRVMFERDFDASNAFGGTISSRYQCEIDADSGRVTHFAIREAGGWKKLI